ncbi:MAG: type VI secretion system baseplate subunit TssE [Planctomycetota bacterium]
MFKPIPSESPLLPSLLDRLLDDHPEESREPAWRDVQVVRVLKASLCRDLQNLLNAHRLLAVIPEAYAELKTSLLNYGLPDLQSMEVREDHDLGLLCRLIEESIQVFEPRLQGVRVRPVIDAEGRKLIDRRVRFEIEAVLVVEPLREPVLFSSLLDVSSGEFAVEGTK